MFETLSEPEQAATRRLFGRLVIQDGGETSKRRILRDELAEDRDGQRCIDRLAAARLLTLGRDATTRQPTVEMAHEALLGSWSRLGAWVEADRDHLRTHRHLTNAAAEWDRADRPNSELYRGGRLETAVELRRAKPESLNDSEISFLDASIVAEQQRAASDRRRTRTLQGLLAGTAVLLVAALIAGLVAFQQRDEATAARNEAEQNAAEARANSADAERARGDAEDLREAAETSRLSAEAVLLAESDPQLAYLLAVEAYRREPSPDTLGAIQRIALRTGGVTQYLGSADKSYRDVRWADDDTIVAAHLGGIEVFSRSSSELLMSLDAAVRTEIGNREPGEGEIVAFDVSPDGRWAAVGSDFSTAEILDLGTGESMSIAHPEPVAALAFATDSGRLATGDATGTVRLWDPADGRMLAEVAAHPETALDLIEEVEAAGGTLEHLIEGLVVDSYGHRGVTRMAFSPDGDELVTTEFPMVRMWDARTLEPLRQFVPMEDRGPEADASGSVRIVPTEPADSLLAFDPIESDHIWLSNGNFVLHRYDTNSGEQVESGSVKTGVSGIATTAPGILRTSDGHWLNLLADGRLLDAPDDGDLAVLAASNLPRSSALAIDTTERLVVGAADGGLFIVPRYGGSALSVGAQRLGGNWFTITNDGGLVAETQFPSGPTHFYRRDGAGYESAAAPEPLTNEAIDIHSTPEGEVLFAALRFDPEEGLAYELSRSENPSTFVRTPGNGLMDQAFHPNKRWTFLFPPFAGPSLAPVIWDLESDRLVAELDPFPAPERWALFPRSAAFSADGSKVIATTTEGIYRIWDTETWELETDGLDIGPVVVADYDPTGTYLATIDLEGVLTLRSATSLEPVRRIPLPGPVDATAAGIEWSSDGRFMLVAATLAPTLWDVQSGTQIGSPFPSVQGSIPGAESSQSIQLVTARSDSIDIWNLDLDSWPTAACVAAGRNMTPDEWETVGPRDTSYRATCPQFES